MRSPPAWGAWIETRHIKVDWVAWGSRPPRGGRGLKLVEPQLCVPAGKSPPAWGAWIETMSIAYQHDGLAVAPRVGGVD